MEGCPCIARAWLVVFSLALLPVSASAEDDFIIIEEETVETPSTQVLDFLEKYGELSIGGYQVFGSSISRGFANINTGLNAPFELGRPGRVVLDLGFTTQRLKLEQELEDKDNNPDMLPEERTLKVKEDRLEFYEAYLSYEPLPNLVLTAGRERPIWGQFDIFSPVNFLLPLEFQSRKFSIHKANYRRPQDLISATWFPHERVELRAYYFLSTRVDPIFEEALASSKDRNELPNLNPDGTITQIESLDDDGNPVLENSVRSVPRRDTDFEDYDAYAVRLLYYDDAFTVGFTWYNGRNSFSFGAFPRVQVFAASGALPNPNGSDIVDVYTNERSLLPQANAYAVEIAVPYGRWTWKGELVYNETAFSFDEVARETITDRTPNAAARREFYNWIVNNNDGKGYADLDGIWATVGFDTDYELWNFGLSVIMLRAFPSSDVKRANKLQDDAYPDSESDDFSDVFPNAYAFYKFGRARDQRLGVATGFLGSIFGFTAYYNGSWQDNFSWTVSAEYLASISDFFISAANDLDGNYQLKDGISLGFRAGLSYEF